MTEHIRLTRKELHSPAVDSAIEIRRQLTERMPLEEVEVSTLRKWLLSSMVYLPFAGFLGALLAWLILEPMMSDMSVVGGEIVLVQTDPLEFSRDWSFDRSAGKPIKITVGECDVIILTGMTRREPGAGGQPPIRSWDELAPGEVVEVSGEVPEDGFGTTLIAVAIRPATPEHAAATGNEVTEGVTAAEVLFFPLTAVLVCLFLLLAEGISSRNWVRTTERTFLGVLLTTVFSFLAFVPAGISLSIGQSLVGSVEGVATSKEFPGGVFFAFTVCRSIAWACLGVALGLGMNMVRSTKAEKRNSAIGGLLGGALGGLIFGILERVVGSNSFFQGAEASRFFGLIAVGVCVGVFVALVDRLAREAWLKVRTGPLAGKAFVLYKSPTRLGSAPRADIYLFKDAGIDPDHALIHRVGNKYELEDLRSRGGTKVGRQDVRRHRLQSGDRIQLGSTILEFEERAGRKDKA